jgi:hypothetical protein
MVFPEAGVETSLATIMQILGVVESSHARSLDLVEL